MGQSVIIEGTRDEVISHLTKSNGAKRFRLLEVDNEHAPFYETASAEQWIAAFLEWAASPFSYEITVAVGDRQCGFYVVRGKDSINRVFSMPHLPTAWARAPRLSPFAGL